MTPFEGSLSARRPRRVPAEWRGAILAAAMTDQPSLVRSAASQPKTHGFWLAVAAVWILLAAAQLDGWRQDAAVAARLGPGPTHSIAEQRRLNRELESLVADLPNIYEVFYALPDAERRCPNCGTVHPGSDFAAWHSQLAGSKAFSAESFQRG